MIIMYIHIPRTAGTSLGMVLREYFKGYYIFYPIERYGVPNTLNNPGETHFIELARLIREAQKEHENIYIQGHVPYGIHRYIESPVKYITIVRDSVKRVWSRFNAYTSAYNYTIYKRWKKEYEFDIKKILQAGELELCNDQTRLIIGTCRKEITEADADTAIELLINKYAWVGTVEDFWKSGSEFSRALGIPNIQFNETRFNSVGYSIGRHPSPEQRSLIVKCNLQDQKVYEYIRDCRLGLIPGVSMKFFTATVVKVDILTGG